MFDLARESFRPNIIFLKVAGLFPTERHKKLYNVYAYIMYFLFVVPDPTLDVAYLITDENVTLTKVIDNMFLIAQTGSFIIKELIWIRNFKEIEETIDYLKLPIFNNYKKRHLDMFKECFKSCRLITWLFFGFCEMSIVGLAIRPIFSGVKYKMPIDIWLPFEFNENRTPLFLFFYAYVALGIFCVGSSNGMLDPLVAGLLCHAGTQVSVLKNNLQHLYGDVIEEVEAEKIDDETALQHKQRIQDVTYRKICEFVDHHSAIIKFVNMLENTYSYVIFTQFLTATFVICISCYQMTTYELFSVPFFGMLVYFLTMIIEIYLFSYYGTILYDESNSLTTAAYMGEWYNLDVRSRRALLVLMERSKKPMLVTAGKILEVSVVSFSTTCRRAYSLLAVLKSY